MYHYFEGLEGLRRALALEGIRQISTRIGQAVMGKAGDEAVVALAEALWNFAKERSGLYEATQRAPDAEDKEWRSAGHGVVDIMLRALSAYNLSDEEGRYVVRMLRSIVHGCVSLENIGGFDDVSQADETFRWLLASLLTYLHNERS